MDSIFIVIEVTVWVLWRTEPKGDIYIYMYTHTHIHPIIYIHTCPYIPIHSYIYFETMQTIWMSQRM